MAAPGTVETTDTSFHPVACDWLRTPSLARRPGETAEIPASTSIPLSFVRRLAADAGLRSELETAPAATLARHGICVAPDTIPAAVSLPSKQDLDSLVCQYASTEERHINPWEFVGFLGGSFD